jgi:hypothetical protein
MAARNARTRLFLTPYMRCKMCIASETYVHVHFRGGLGRLLA